MLHLVLVNIITLQNISYFACYNIVQMVECTRCLSTSYVVVCSLFTVLPDNTATPIYYWKNSLAWLFSPSCCSLHRYTQSMCLSSHFYCLQLTAKSSYNHMYCVIDSTLGIDEVLQYNLDYQTPIIQTFR